MKSGFSRISAALVVGAALLLSACGADATATTAPVATPTPAATTAPTNTSAPQATATTPATSTSAPATNTVAPTATTAPATATSPAVIPTVTQATGPIATPETTATSEAVATAGGLQTDYLDNRSDPGNTIKSYYNAIDRHEYLRAYSYWQSGAAGLAPFAQFQQGFNDTQEVEVTIGKVGIGVGAGQQYGVVPVTVTSTTSAGQQVFVGCYTTHLGSPDSQAQPPFVGTSIQQADVKQAPAGADTDSLMATACDTSGVAPDGYATPVAPSGPNDVSPSLYIDNRSDAVSVLQSYYNAINSKQYDRAYSYWQSGAAGLQPFDQFQQGFANTQAVALTTGSVVSDPGAGQLNYSVPTVIKTTLADGSSQTFSGCYTLHLAQPAIQATAPFAPLGITGANLKQAAAGASADALLQNACK